MAGDATNVRGPCSSCGAPLAIDQRYCVECGQRVGPPLALPYALPAAVPGQPPAGGGWLSALPMPAQMVSAFAALSLGFGAILGTAISPNLGSIIAAPAPGAIAEAPPETPPASTGGGGGGALSPAGGSAGTIASSATPAGSGSGSGAGGGGGGGGKKKHKKKKRQPAPPVTTAGVVVRVNPVAQSYTISSGSSLLSIHSTSPPKVGDVIEVATARLANGTYREDGARSANGTSDQASFTGTVTYCADLEQPSQPCDPFTASGDHYVYSVSSPGASVLVSAPNPTSAAPPKMGSQLTVTVHIGNAFSPIDQVGPSPPPDPDCPPPATALPSPPVTAPELMQTNVNVTGQAKASILEAVVQVACPGSSPKLILSADDIRQAERDLPVLAVPNGIDLAKLTPGEAVQAAVDIAADGTLSLTGITSDQGQAGADDPAQGQGTLTGT